jgi:hypothetical protein
LLTTTIYNTYLVTYLLHEETHRLALLRKIASILTNIELDTNLNLKSYVIWCLIDLLYLSTFHRTLLCQSSRSPIHTAIPHAQLKIEVASYSDTSVTIYRSTRRDIRTLNTHKNRCQNRNLPPPISSLQRSKRSSPLWMKVFNYLLSKIQNFSHDTKQFKLALKSFILTNLFYTLDQYFNWKFSKDFGSV